MDTDLSAVLRGENKQTEIQETLYKRRGKKLPLYHYFLRILFKSAGE